MAKVGEYSSDPLDLGIDPATTSRTRTEDPMTGATIDSETLNLNRRDSRNAGPADVGAVRRIIRHSKPRKDLGAEGTEYLETLRKELAADDNDNRNKVQLLELPADGAYIATNGNSAIYLVFDEVQRAASTENEFKPSCININRISRDTMVSDEINRRDLNPTDAILIPQSDYKDVTGKDTNRARTIGKLAANNIKNMLGDALGAEFTMEMLERFPIRIVHNQQEVQQHLIDNYPGGVLPYYQQGLAVEICIDERALRDKEANPSKWDRDSYDWELLFMLGEITEFHGNVRDARPYNIRRKDEPKPYQPIVTITACVAGMSSVKLHPFMMAIAEEVFIRQGRWKEFFLNPSEEVNLGGLFIDPEQKRPSFAQDQHQVMDIIENDCEYPSLAVDVRYGAFNHPAFSVLGQPGNRTLIDELDELKLKDDFDLDVLKEEVVQDFVFYSGQVVDEGNLVDTRSIDYFRALHAVSDDDLLNRFLTYRENPEERIRAIHDAGWRPKANTMTRGSQRALESLYTTTRYIIDARAIREMLQMTSTLNIIFNLRQYDEDAFDIDLIRRNSSLMRERDRSLMSGRSSRNDDRSFAGFYRRSGR